MVEILKVDGYEVKDPVFDYEENAGADFFVPKYNETFAKDFAKYNPDVQIDSKDGEYFFRLAPHKNVIVPAGWYTKFGNDMAFIVCNKSGVANKQHLSFSAHIIDASYQGVLLLSVFNYSEDWTIIKCDEKLVQLLQVPILKGLNIVTGKTKEEFFEKESKRGAGALGSTGLK